MMGRASGGAGRLPRTGFGFSTNLSELNTSQQNALLRRIQARGIQAQFVETPRQGLGVQFINPNIAPSRTGRFSGFTTTNANEILSHARGGTQSQRILRKSGIIR